MKFLRRTWNRYSKLGKRRKKKQVWRRPTGRDNKMREKRRGYPKHVSTGYKKDKRELKKPILVNNPLDLEKIQKNDFIILGKMGKKKKIEMLKKAKAKKIEFENVNLNKFLKKNKIKEKENIKEDNKNEPRQKKEFSKKNTE